MAGLALSCEETLGLGDGLFDHFDDPSGLAVVDFASGADEARMNGVG